MYADAEACTLEMIGSAAGMYEEVETDGRSNRPR